MLECGKLGMHVWRGCLGHVIAPGSLGLRIAHHLQHVVERCIARGGYPCLTFRGRLVRSTTLASSAWPIAASCHV